MSEHRKLYRRIAKASMAVSMFLLLVMTSGLAAPEAKAQDDAGAYGEAAQAASALYCMVGAQVQVPVVSPGSGGIGVHNTRECYYFDIAKARIAEARGSLQFLIVKALLSVMHNTVIKLSTDMAQWAVTGFHGKPAFYEQGWKDFLGNIAMDTINRFIDEADKSWGLGLCQKPSFALKLSLGLGGPVPVKPPDCTLQTISKNYEAVYRSLSPREVATTLLKSIDLKGNDIDIGLRVNSLLAERIRQETTGAAYDRNETNGLKYVKKGPLSSLIKTPAKVVNDTLAASNVAKTTSEVTVAEMNTLALSAMWTGIKQLPLVAGMTVLGIVAQALLDKALNALMEPNSGDSVDITAVDLTNPYAETQNEPRKTGSLQKAFTDIIAPNLISADKIDLISEMSVCNDPRSYWGCTMDEGLGTALRNSNENGAFTVIRATGVGGGTQYLHPDWELIPVTEAKDDQDSGCYQRAYCSSNLAKMRFARILPIGWELAANSPFNVKTNGKYVTLGEVMAGFNDCNKDNSVDAQHKWCHLIDPSWVLTSPPFMCQEKGYGDTLQAPDMGMRIQECTDLVSCLKRDDKGICTGGYGYCLSDKTVWRFGADSCDEKFVSCRTYTSRDEGYQKGKDVSLVRNTIDYGACNQDNIGCMYYATIHDTSTTTTGKWVNNVEQIKKSGLTAGINLDKANTAGTPRVYFDSTVQPCDASGDGCTKVLKTLKGKTAVNLVRDGSFEDTLDIQPASYDGWFDAGTKTPAVVNTLDTVDGDLTFDGAISQAWTGIKKIDQTVKVEPSRNYVLSYYARSNGAGAKTSVTAVLLKSNNAKVASGTEYYRSTNCNGIYVGAADADKFTGANVGVDNLTSTWQRYTCEFVTNQDAVSARIVVSGSNAAVDAIQLEEADAATDFVDGVAVLNADYLKLAPEEFKCTGDEKVDRKECANFAQVCRQTDAGCQGYTEVGGGDRTEIPAILSTNDACPNSCVGYAEYRKLPSAFDLVNTGSANPALDPLDDPNDDSKATFVPKYAQACTAAQAGCEEFTNLEASAAGGEDKIYLNYARACQKPSDKSQTYFTWEGSDTTGYQLRTWSLIKDTNAVPLPPDNAMHNPPQLLRKAGPDGVLKNPADCNAVSWKSGTDSDCRQFYDEKGGAFYAFFSQTIVSSVDCTDYRKNDSTADDCGKTGGDFKQATSDCIYHILQSESGTCDAANAGCRGYIGTTGRNTATVLDEMFATTTSAFYGSGGTVLKISTEALLVGDHSLQVSGGGVLSANVDFAATTNTLYTVSFWLKSLPQNINDKNKTVNIKLDGVLAGTFTASNDWRRFEIGPFRATGTKNSKLTWEGLPNVSYLDNVTILRQQDVVFVKKGSWTIPAECDQTTEGIPQPQAMLGCREFRDRLGKVFDVRQFSRLCRYQDVGCTSYVDTRNSDSAYGQDFPLKGLDVPGANGKTWDTLYSGTVTVTRPADRFIYVIDEPSAHCSADQMSCRAFGKPKFDVFGSPSSTHETVYFKDDVTKYTDGGGEPNMLCRPSELFCDKFTSGPLVSYFRDPIDHLVEWKEKVTTSSTVPSLPEAEYSGWFVKGYEPPTAGYPSKVSAGNTFLMEFAGAPGYRGWTAECPAEQSECTEYRDPADDTDQAHPSGKPYFFIANDMLDKGSCKGKVDLLSGCVLFRDMNDSSLPFSTAATYAKAKAQGNAAVSPVNCTTDPNNSYCAGKANDANLIIKVKLDRDCQTWLGCSSAETVYDPAQQKYVDLCTNLAVCDQVGGTSSKNFCGHYVDRVGGADQVLAKGRFLDIGNYMSRPTGYGKPDYSGFSIPNHFQVADLGMRRMGYELLATRPNYVKDKFYNDFRLTANVPMGSLPWNAVDFTDKNYPYLKLCRQPQTGLIGYKVENETPSMCHLSIDKPYTTLLIEVLGQGTTNPNNAQQVATTLEQSGSLSSNKTLNRSFPPVDCRAHPDSAAPFGNEFIKEWSMTSDPPVPKTYVDGYNGVNYCEYGEDCDCSYRKVAYQGRNKYYAAFSGGAPAGICVGGQDDGKACDPGIVVSAPSTSNAPAGTNDDLKTKTATPPGSGGGGGSSSINTCRGGGCFAYTSDTLVRGVPGQCLLRDYGRRLGGSQDLNPCLIWNPSPVLVGQDDRYHYQPSAGYLPPANSGEYYCMSSAKEPRKLSIKATNCIPDYNFAAYDGPWSVGGPPYYNCTQYYDKTDAGLLNNTAEPGSIVAQPPGKMAIFHYDECNVIDRNVERDFSTPWPFDSPGTDDDWYEHLCGTSFATLDGVEATGGDGAAACASIRNAYGGGAMAEDQTSGRWVTTGRGASRNYAEYFIRFNPDAWAKWLLGVATPSAEQVKRASLETNFTYFRFKPMYKTGVGGSWACGMSGWWTDEFPVTGSGDGWNQAANTMITALLKEMNDLTPQGFGYLKNEKGTKLERLPCMFEENKDTAADSEGLCYYKYWEMGYRADSQRKFRMFYDSFGGPQKLDPTNVMFSESEASKPFFAIRAMFEDTLPADNAVPPSQLDPSGLQLGGPFRFVGWWVTASFPGATSERYIYMGMDVGNADVCREVARVKSPDTKQTAAFTDRVWDGGSFSLPVLGFIFSQGSAPFGAALNTRDIAQEPLYQLGPQTTEQTVKAGANKPTWLASGASYSKTLAMPTANWGYLTNLFAKVYQVYRYQDQAVGPTSWACTDGPRFGSACPDMSTEVAPGYVIDPNTNKPKLDSNGNPIPDGTTHYKDKAECLATGCSFPLNKDGGTSAPDISVKYCGWAGTCNSNAVDPSQGQALCNSMSGVNAGLACSGSLGGAQSYHICHLAPVKSVGGQMTPQYTSCGIASGWEQVKDSEGNLSELYRKAGTATCTAGSDCWTRKSAAQRGAFQCASGAVTMPDGKLAWCRTNSGGQPSPDCPIKVTGGGSGPNDSSCDCSDKVGGDCPSTAGRCTNGYEQAACKKDSDCQFTWKEWWGVDFQKNSGPPDKPMWYFQDSYVLNPDKTSQGTPYQHQSLNNNAWGYTTDLNNVGKARGTLWWTGNWYFKQNGWLGTDLQDSTLDIGRKDLTGSRLVWLDYGFDGKINTASRFPGVYVVGRISELKDLSNNDLQIMIPAHCERPPIPSGIKEDLCKKMSGSVALDCVNKTPDLPYIKEVTGQVYHSGGNYDPNNIENPKEITVGRYIGDSTQPWKTGTCEFGIFENRGCSRDSDCAPALMAKIDQNASSFFCNAVSKKEGGKLVPNTGGFTYFEGDMGGQSADVWCKANPDKCSSVSTNCLATTGDAGSKDLDKDNNMCTHYSGYYPRPDICGGDISKQQCLTGILQMDPDVRKSFDLRKSTPPTDVSSGLHLPPYIASKNPDPNNAVKYLNSADYSADYTYMAFYAPRPPMVAAPDTSKQCPSPGQCPISQVGAFSLEGSSEGKVAYVGGQVQTNIRFYGWAADNQMGLKDLWLDWGDSVTQEYHDARMKNKKPICGTTKQCEFVPGLGCNTDNDCPPAGGKCSPVGSCAAKPQTSCISDLDCYEGGLDVGDKCQSRLTFGNSDGACEQNFFEFTHVYTCPKEAINPSVMPACGTTRYCSRDNTRDCSNSKPCAIGDTCLTTTDMAPPGGCYDATNSACRFTPRLLLKDNWGWCAGECRVENLGGGKLGPGFNWSNLIYNKPTNNNILLPNGGCYDATGVTLNKDPSQSLVVGYLNVGGSPKSVYNMCDPYATKGTDYRPWIVFKGAMQLGIAP